MTTRDGQGRFIHTPPFRPHHCEESDILGFIALCLCIMGVLGAVFLNYKAIRLDSEFAQVEADLRGLTDYTATSQLRVLERSRSYESKCRRAWQALHHHHNTLAFAILDERVK